MIFISAERRRCRLEAPTYRDLASSPPSVRECLAGRNTTSLFHSAPTHGKQMVEAGSAGTSVRLLTLELNIRALTRSCE
jgi:hypothetical protein